MTVDGHDAQPTAHPRVDDQLGGQGEHTDEQQAAYPGDEHDVADEHLRPSFSDELSDSPTTIP